MRLKLTSLITCSVKQGEAGISGEDAGKVVLGADGAMFSSTAPSGAALGYSPGANTEIKFAPPRQGLAGTWHR